MNVLKSNLSAEIPKIELLWTNVSVQEVIKEEFRLDASYFDIEGRHARDVIENCKFPKKRLAGNDGLSSCYLRPRFKRIFLPKSDLPIFQPSQINEISPKEELFISHLTNTDKKKLRVHKGQILVTRSGTVGNCTYVNKTLDGKIFSDDLIRINANSKTDAGFIYTFLKSTLGNKLIQTNKYGAVIKHIEPEHLEDVLIPNPDKEIKESIHKLVIKSFDHLDESNDLIHKAHNLLIEHLKLPPIEKIKIKYFRNSKKTQSYSLNVNDLDNRLDGSYHVPIISSISSHLEKYADEVTTIADDRISEKIVLPGRFKRVYVEKGQGAVFFGGKQLLELNPNGKKYLSLVHHGDRIKDQLQLIENMVLISCSGTIGKIMIVPKHWENWTVNQHIIRIVPKEKNIAGYIYAWLSTDFGQELIKRFTYGAVVDEIDDNHVSQVLIPLLKSKQAQKKINDLVLQANEKRYQAYLLEQKALKELDEKVFYL
tara:strand:- start:65 stop:1513 length:1449 start_codon:yes stop_codon:yes gene_type:complete